MRRAAKMLLVPAAAQKLQGFIDAEMLRWGKVVNAAGLAGTE
jgi:hypothetical protein